MTEATISVDLLEGSIAQGEITLTPTIGSFVMCDDAEVLVLQGPRGEGKTVGGVARLLRVAATNPAAQPLKGIVIRDSWVNIERTVIETLIEGRLKGWWDVELRDQGRQAILNGGRVKLFLFGMEFLPDANKLQGLSAAVGWIEEPAPAADLSSGVPVDVYGLLWSSLRQPGFPSTVQLPMNPPDSDHWTQKLTSTPHLRLRRFQIPPGENPHLPVGYRERMREALEQSGRGDLVARLVEGKVGDVVMGEAVIPPFSRLMHVADQPLQIYQSIPEVCRFWDSGTPNLHPAVVWAQPGPFGLNILGSRVATNMGTQEFIEEEVKPFERRYFRHDLTPVKAAQGFQKALHRGWRWRNIGDPSCLTPEGTSSERTVALVIQNMLGGGFEPGPQDWDRVRQALLAVFLKSGKGDRKRFVQVDPEENELLIRALAGRFRFPTDKATGRIQGTWVAAKRVSGIYCVDEQTEILTMSGWCHHEDLKEGLAVYGYRNGRLTRDRLQGVHRFVNTHRVLSFQSDSLSMVVTPDHRCLARRRRTYRRGPSHLVEAKFVAASDLTTGDYLVRSGVIERFRPRLSDDFVALCGWVFAEGYYRGDGTISINQSPSANPEYCAWLDRLVLKFGGRRIADGTGRLRCWRIRNETAALIQLLMPGAKVPSPHFWAQLSCHQARLFVYEACRGDGNWANRADALPDPPKRFWRSGENFLYGGTVRIWQMVPERIEALQVIATLGGLPSRRHPIDSQGRHGLSLFSRRFLTCVGQTRRTEIEVPMVWCPQTESGAWIARREGSVFVTGNSHPVDALGYGCAVLYPPEEWVRRPAVPYRPTEREPRSWVGR